MKNETHGVIHRMCIWANVRVCRHTANLHPDRINLHKLVNEMTNTLFSKRNGKMITEIRANQYVARLHVTSNTFINWETIEITPEMANQMIHVLTKYVKASKNV